MWGKTYVVKEKEYGRYQTNRLHDRLPRDGKRLSSYKGVLL